jgi:inner membrane protein
MDTITHTLFGLTIYGAVKKEEMSKNTKRALLFSAIVGSQIPDIDVVMNLTETGRIMAQMWHRGLTHSIFLAPVWSAIIFLASYLIWKVKERQVFTIALISVLIHIGSDSLNTWGTGLFEPISSVRISIGTLSIVDFVIWGIMLIGFVLSFLKKNIPSHRIYRTVWVFIVLHLFVQGIHGYIIYQDASKKYDQVALKSEFVPWKFSVIGKKSDIVEVSQRTLWSDSGVKYRIHSAEHADLTPLLVGNPKAEVLMKWSPFVVIVDDGKRLGVFDPRFYQNGEPFLYEYIELSK